MRLFTYRESPNNGAKIVFQCKAYCLKEADVLFQKATGRSADNFPFTQITMIDSDDIDEEK